MPEGTGHTKRTLPHGAQDGMCGCWIGCNGPAVSVSSESDDRLTPSQSPSSSIQCVCDGPGSVRHVGSFAPQGRSMPAPTLTIRHGRTDDGKSGWAMQRSGSEMTLLMRLPKFQNVLRTGLF
jgi:hypothetical protein